MIADEGCSVLSDHNGKLLCYTNGISLINRKHQLMKNGDKLMGDLSSTNNTVFVPSISNDSILYLFTIGSAFQPEKGFRYSIINLRGDGGFGEVIEKNISLEPAAFEKIAAIRHCNNKDVWIVIHKWNTDEYHAYHVDGTGINAVPVISHTGLIITGSKDNTVGALKFSGNGQHLAALHAYENNVVELMDFDNKTGIITNPVVFRPDPVGLPQTFTGVYGAEFSPNGNLLYVSDNSLSDGPSAIFQFDISSHNSAIINATKQVIASPDPFFSGALQIGPDQKIYISLLGDTSISVIENPDVYGPGCNFVPKKIFLGQNNIARLNFGLPNFIQSYFNPLSNRYDFSRSGNCTKHDVSFNISRLTGVDSVKWDFGDNQKSQQLAPTNHFTNAGFYDVKLIVYKIDCSGLNDTINHRIWIADDPDFLGPDTSTCASIQVQLGIDNIDGASYLWNTGSIDDKITTADPGTYWMELEVEGCTVRDTINLFLRNPPVVNIGSDTTVCTARPIILRTGNAITDKYLWSTGETSSSISINKTGIYYVTVSENNCIASDTIVVAVGDCEPFIPTAFTPNNDGLNDNFGVASGFATNGFHMQVFDRWGNTVFVSANNTIKWDGTQKGKPMPNGAYSWYISYTDTRIRKIFLQGTVMLIR